MRTRKFWVLSSVAAFAAMAVASPAPSWAQARDARMTDQRIAACSAILKTGRLRGEAAGVAYELRGLAYLDRGDIAHSIADLNQAVALAPEFVPAYQNRGNAWYARGNFGQAIADYDAEIKLDPNSASPYVNRAAVRRDLGFLDGAMEDYAKAIDLDPGKATAYSGRGQVYMRQRDYGRALTDFDHALQLDQSAGNYMLRAQAKQASADNGALADFAEAARLDPKNVAALTSEAAIWRKSGENDKAIAAYDRVLSADPRSPGTYKLRAEAYAARATGKPRWPISTRRSSWPGTSTQSGCAAASGSTMATSAARSTTPTSS
jgi:tetratricopeptide (TPR) repeat protein